MYFANSFLYAQIIVSLSDSMVHMLKYTIDVLSEERKLY